MQMYVIYGHKPVQILGSLEKKLARENEDPLKPPPSKVWFNVYLRMLACSSPELLGQWIHAEGG